MRPRPRLLRVLVAIAALIAGSVVEAGVEGQASLSLAGTWRFELDREDRGLVEGWGEGRVLAGEIALPGTLQAQGFGDEVGVDTPWTGQIVDRSFFTSPRYAPYRQPGQVKVPFWLQPDRHYVGPAWYQREVVVPPSFAGRRLVLHLERPHWQTLVWLDDRLVGSNDSLSTPHEHDLGTAVVPGPHRLTVRVDNRLVVDVGVNSHSVSDHTQGNWNGIVGMIELRASSPVWVDDLQAYPGLEHRSVRLRARIGNATGAAGEGRLRVSVEPRNGAYDVRPSTELGVRWDAGGGALSAELPLGAAASTWDEFRPALYRLTADLEGPAGRDVRQVPFGLREVTTRGTQFVINDRKAFIRGTLECAIFPRTGHPPTDVASWKRIVGIAKAHGLNAIRFHSWCPPEAAFVAADELGFYYQVEVASWANSSTRLGVGLPIDDWLYRESDRILKAYGNHPSFLLMPYGNEPAGRDREFLAAWVEHYRQADPRRLYTSASGWPEIPENQFHVSPGPRIQAWGEGLRSRVNARAPETRSDYRDYVGARTVPVISHEIGQWCAYPNLAERAKYTGPLKAKNFDIVADSLAAHGMADQAQAFLQASGKLQALLYKEEIESALRTPGMGGFELLDLHDFPGQGTALVGVLDAFWDSKGYVTADAYRRFCNATVPLVRLDRRVFTSDETLRADLEVAHFGAAPITSARPEWRLLDASGRTLRQGVLPARELPVDNGTPLGRLELRLAGLPVPARYRLEVALGGTPFANDWDVWVYPKHVDTAVPPSVRFVHELDDAVERQLQGGARVVLAIAPDRLRGDEAGKVELGFSSIFWNTAWTGRQAPHTLGILCDPGHPALAGFPTESHSNWQWWYVVSRAGAMILDGLPAGLRPTVQVIDDWFTNRRLGLVFEARVGRGRLLVTSVDLERGLDRDPVARQLRRALLRYAAGERFAPLAEVRADEVRRLMR
ncbi:MAG TPA: glycoside hydrolase [Vicinamibacteria bacterium]|nr:glycoside hydrolase [Vicinamibacteria bacterium]